MSGDCPRWKATGTPCGCAWTTDDSGRQLYQQGGLETLLKVPQLIAEVERRGFTTERRLMFGGTLPTVGDFVFGRHFEAELRDPELNRQLRCAYTVVVSPPRDRASPE